MQRKSKRGLFNASITLRWLRPRFAYQLPLVGICLPRRKTPPDRAPQQMETHRMNKILFVAAITAALATLVVVLDHHPVGGVLLVELAAVVKPLR